MSSRKGYVRDQFAAIMRGRDGLATHNTSVAPRSVEPPSGSVSGPSHPAFDRLEEMRTKELKDVSGKLSRLSIQSGFERWAYGSSGVRNPQEGVHQAPRQVRRVCCKGFRYGR